MIQGTGRGRNLVGAGRSGFSSASVEEQLASNVAKVQQHEEDLAATEVRCCLWMCPDVELLPGGLSLTMFEPCTKSHVLVNDKCNKVPQLRNKRLCRSISWIITQCYSMLTPLRWRPGLIACVWSGVLPLAGCSWSGAVGESHAWPRLHHSWWSPRWKILRWFMIVRISQYQKELFWSEVVM